MLSLVSSFLLLLLLVAGVALWRSLHPVAPSAEDLDTRFSRRVVWITGASSGIGRALALSFASCGSLLILSGRDEAALKAVQQQCRQRLTQRQQRRGEQSKGIPDVIILPFDLATVADPNNDTQLQQLVRRAAAAHPHQAGKIDILVNNGGMSVRGSVRDTQLSVDHRLMNVNYFGCIALTKAVLPHLSQRHAQILVISSVQGLLSVGHRSAYAASKHALHGFFDALRYETDPQQLHICLVCPGYVQTNLSLNALQGDGSRYDRLDETTAKGMTPDSVAQRCLAALYHQQAEVVLADLKSTIAVYLRLLTPSMLEKIMRKRAMKEAPNKAA